MVKATVNESLQHASFVIPKVTRVKFLNLAKITRKAKIKHWHRKKILYD